MAFVSRVNATDAKQHQILGVQRFKPAEFAQQVGVKSSSLWGSLNLFLDTLQLFENGTYLIFRDPNEPIIRFYSLPSDAALH
jgi:translation initiation factor 3 subunit D